MTYFKEKWINAQEAKVLVEKIQDKKERYIEAKILPFGQISRNGVMYSKESALKTHQQLVGKPLMHNHEINGRENFPRGKWVEANIKEDGLYGKAKVYDTSYNKEYIEWLEAEESPQVSLQITGDAESCKTKEGKYYQNANIQDWLEISTVNCPGFLDAKGNFEAIMSEMLHKKEDNIMKEAVDEFKIGDKVGTDNGDGVITDVTGNQVSIKLDDMNTTQTFSVMDIWKSESMKEDHLKVGDVIDVGGKKMIVDKVNDNGYVVKYNKSNEDEEEQPPEQPEEPVMEGFFEQLNKIRGEY